MHEFSQLCIPRASLLSRTATQWQTIAMAYMHQPTHEFPQVCLPFPFIAVCTAPAFTERTINGSTKIDSIKAGEIVVVPANVGSASHFCDEYKCLELYLEGSAKL